jgi:dipeptidyl aminopeptidase/acylaminoacyl peptidase
VASGCAAAEPEVLPSQPFTVERAIESERVLTLTGRSFAETSTPATEQFALFSPGGSRFIARVRRGDIARDVNVDTVLLWQQAQVDQALHSGQPLPPPVRVHAHAFHEDGGGLDSLKWESAATLSFLAQNEGDAVQAFLLDTDSKRVTRLTHAATDVVSFAVSKHHTIYYAREPVVRPPTVVSAADLSLYDLYNLDAGRERGLILYKQTRASRPPEPLTQGAYSSVEPRIWISPDERYAITLAPEVHPPASWRQYQVRTRNYTDIDVRDPKSLENAQRLRYVLIDLRTGSSRALLDAPAGLLASNGTPLKVFWPTQRATVIVSNTYLPIAAEAATAPILQPVVAEISLETGAAVAIASEPVAKPGQALNDKVVDLAYDDAASELRIMRRTGDAFSAETYRKGSGAWQRIATASAASVYSDRLRVWVRQNERERPRIYCANSAGQERELYDPTPEFAGYSFGRQETFNVAFQGTDRKAAMVYPVGYREGQRYPLILQTHGLGKDEYLLEGPNGATNSYAAQAFANAGFIVAQLPDARVAGYNTAQEGPDNAEYWRTAIDQLAERGLIDREKIGVIAWSRTGYHLLAALARYPQLFKAASISDAIQYGSYLQLLTTPARRDRLGSHAEMTSGPAFERGLPRWLEDQNVFYASLKSRTPLRIEGMGTPISMWETFATRRMQGLPVDFIYYPSGSHSLLKPSERLASQGGSLDWFRFWLQGYEDPARAKADQYRRWRSLRSTETVDSGGLPSTL